MPDQPHFKLSNAWQKCLLLIALGLILLVVGILYAFPNVDMMTDRCIVCGRSRTYYQIEGRNTGSTIYNLKLDAVGNPSHHHMYTDPQYTHLGMLPRWKLHPGRKQSD